MTLRLDDEVGRNPGGAGNAAARADDSPRTPPPSQKEPTSGGALADALRRRGVSDPAASLTAQAGIAVFRIAFERWLDPSNFLPDGTQRASLSDISKAS